MSDQKQKISTFSMNSPANLTIIILTFNEELHIERCLNSAFQIASTVFLVDSYSTDRTVSIAQSLGAHVWQHKFKNHAEQFSWGLENLPIDTEWVMRVDADEIISSELAENLRASFAKNNSEVNGFLVCRYVTFMGKIIRHGNFPQWVLKVWRRDLAEIEIRWMDEHIVLRSGRAERVAGKFIDDNLNSVSWWIAKHNIYASREAIDLLNKKHRFLCCSNEVYPLGGMARIKRWLKNNVYSRMPLGARAFAYFFYRLFFQLGFLDGCRGFAFHFFQACWYRYLVDMKVLEVECKVRKEQICLEEAIWKVLQVKL